MTSRGIDARLRVRFARSDERETWNRFVAVVPEGHILQSWEWGEFKALHGWLPMRVVLEEPAPKVNIWPALSFSCATLSSACRYQSLIFHAAR